jgi:hypothetical protein
MVLVSRTAVSMFKLLNKNRPSELIPHVEKIGGENQ